MIKKPLENLNQPGSKMAKFPNLVFKLLWIQRLNVTPQGKLFSVLLKDIKSGMFINEFIYPEHLWYYTVGTHYRDSKKFEDIPPEGKALDITVDLTADKKIQRINQVINDKEYNLNHTFDGERGQISYSNENKRQFCIVLETTNQKVIFSCAVIAATYYFLSTSMREQIFAQNLKGLYDAVEVDSVTRQAKIYMKPGAADNDAPHIARFDRSEFALKRLMAIQNVVRKEIQVNKTHARLLADFPVKEILKMKVRGVKFPQDDGKEKILVFDILEENSSFEFDDIMIIRNEYEKKKLEPSGDVIDVKECKTTDSLVIKTPSSILSSASIDITMAEKNPNIRKMEKPKEYLPSDASDKTYKTIQSGRNVDISVSSPSEDGKEDVRPGRMQRNEGEVKTKECFNLDNFKDMIGYLKDAGANNLQVNGPTDMPQKKHRKHVISLREVYDNVSKRPRQFLKVTFQDSASYVCLIEIDQNMLPNGSATYVLVSNRDYDFTAGVRDFLEAYVKYERIEKIAVKIKNKGLKFFSKHHPVKKEEKIYKNWCDDLLRGIRSA